ncbi:MAG: CvpA family protein [Bacteroidota bacterium]|nr:CvpA family protein [Bacteroidota bacterium]
MSSIDIILLIVLGVFAFSGWRKGFLRKVISLAALVLAIFLATKYGAFAGRTMLKPFGLSGGAATVAGYLLIIAVVMLIQAILYRMFVKKLAEGVWNKIAGAALGVLEAALLLSVLFIFLGTYLRYPSEETRQHSLFYAPIKGFAPLVMDSFTTFVPEAEDMYHDALQPAEKAKKKLGK